MSPAVFWPYNNPNTIRAPVTAPQTSPLGIANTLLALTAGGGVVRFLPPLTLKEEDLEEATDMISDALDCVFGE